jgi:hypothetical protein
MLPDGGTVMAVLLFPGMLFSGLGADRDRGVNPRVIADRDTPAGPGSPAQADEGRN